MLKYLPAVFASVVMSACSVIESEEETEISVEQVPPEVLSAARTALPGFEITEAEIEKEDGVLVYELDGTSNGKLYEIELTPAGEIVEIEEVEELDEE